MSTVQDFENAPVGATATHPDGIREVIRQGEESDGFPWVCTTYGELFCNEELAEGGYTLVPSAPTTVQEALDLAWELGHPVKEGQVLPEGTRYLQWVEGDLREYTELCDLTVDKERSSLVRTHEPLPDPEPDWLDAPAVLARLKTWTPSAVPTVFARYEHDHSYWLAMGPPAHHWTELHDVTPLYPKERRND